MAATETIVLSEKRVYVAVMEFGDSTMITGRVFVFFSKFLRKE